MSESAFVVVRRGAALAFGLMIATEALAGAAQRTAFGTLPDGTLIEAITLTNGHGIRLASLPSEQRCRRWKRRTVAATWPM